MLNMFAQDKLKPNVTPKTSYIPFCHDSSPVQLNDIQYLTLRELGAPGKSYYHAHENPVYYALD